MLDTRTSQDQLEDLLRDTILYALARRTALVGSIAALRAVVTQGDTGGVLNNDSLAAIVVSNIVTASYRWSQESLAADNGTTVLKPNDVTLTGRWVAWQSFVQFCPTVGSDAYYLHQLMGGPLERVIVLDKGMTPEEASALVGGQVPSVFIEASQDSPKDMTSVTGQRWDTKFEFKVSVIAQNLRGRRQATHGSAPDGAFAVGANLLDGHLKALLSGTNLYPSEDGIRDVQLGTGQNQFSLEAQRRVIRSRDYIIVATEENPPAPNASAPVEEVETQAELTDMGEHGEDEKFDMKNYVSGGLEVPIGFGLTKPVRPGTAIIANTPVTYVGELKTFTASTDTYRDLLSNGTITFIEVMVGQNPPPLTLNAMRIGITRTDNDGILFDNMLAETRIPYLNPVVSSLI